MIHGVLEAGEGEEGVGMEMENEEEGGKGIEKKRERGIEVRLRGKERVGGRERGERGTRS